MYFGIKFNKKLLNLTSFIKLITLALVIYSINLNYCFADSEYKAKEYQAKAALIYSFAKFVTWPPDVYKNKKSPFIIGILGKDPFGDAINLIKDKKINGRAIKVQYYTSIYDYKKCQILYSSPSILHGFTTEQCRQLVKDHVLTIGEIEGFIKIGGILGITLVKENIAFEINSAMARKSDITINSNLINLARTVIDNYEICFDKPFQKNMWAYFMEESVKLLIN